MRQLSAGDIVFSYVGQKIVAVSLVRSSAYERQRPHEFGDLTACVYPVGEDLLLSEILLH